MEFLGELFIEIIGGIAEIIGEELMESVNDDFSGKRPFIKSLIAIIAGLLCWAIIVNAERKRTAHSRRTV